MKKIDFLNELYSYLSPLPKNERTEILEDFRAHFREAEAAGKSEEQICQELGTPFECAKQYVGDALMDNRIEPKKDKKNNKAFWTISFFWNVIQAFFSVPITLGIFLAAAIMIVAFCFIVPYINSIAFLVFAISLTIATLSLGVLSLLWAAIQIKECVDRINK